MANSYLVRPDTVSRMNILVYGDPGAGKTHFAGTAQDVESMRNVHVFNIDGGLLTLASRGDIRATDVRSVDDLENEFRKLVSGDPSYEGVSTVVIDNITELQTLCLEGITSAAYADRRKKDKTYTIDDVYIEDYGKAGKQLSRVLRGFRDLPINVIYVAHRKDKMRKGTSILEATMPNMSDKLCTAIMGYMDFVWYLYTADKAQEAPDGQVTTSTERYLLTQPMNNYAAKTRGNAFAQALGPVVEAPTMPAIMKAFHDAMSQG